MSDQTTQQPGAEKPGAESADGTLSAGTRVGRLVVLQKVGEGGMGRAYSAYDRVLDRRVCLKFLKGHNDSDSIQSNQRLITEARVLAQLSHPNILPVFDVGQFEDQVYLVTEFVDGWTLAEWVETSKPDAPQIVATYRSAGAGLAAAHASGIVHRDFKPENVMIGRDGRVRVMDFGLAAPEQDIDELRDGLGTPRYMAPEQFRGQAATPRSDQYAFCLSLATALGINAADRRSRIANSSPSVIDDHQRAALERGLSQQPEQRHADMPALLASLAPQLKTRRRHWLAAAAVLVVLGSTWAMQLREPEVAPCQSLAAPSTTWNAEGRGALRSVFLATGLPYANAAFDRLLPVVDDYLGDWSSQRLAACEATHVRHEQSPEMLDRRMICLDSQLRQLDALGRVLATADAKLVDASLQAVMDLPSPLACADRQGLLSRAPVPDSADAREKFARLDGMLSDAWAERHAGRYAQALQALNGMQADIEAFPHLPTQARFHTIKADTLLESIDKTPAREVFEQALFLALTSGDFSVAADAATGLAFFHSSTGSPIELIETWYQRAGMLTEQLADPGRRAKWANEYGQFLTLEAGRNAEALTQLEFALAEYTRISGPESPRTAMVMNMYAWARHRNGDLDSAIDLGRRSLDAIEASYGTHHNAYLAAANNYASLLTTAHRSDEAIALLEKAYRAGVANVGAEHKDVLFLLLAWASALFEQERYSDALPRFTDVMRDVASSLGRQHRLYGFAATGAGASQRELGDLNAATQTLTEALAAGGDRYPPILRASMSYELAQTLERSGAATSRILELAESALRDGASAPAEWRAEVDAFAGRWRQ